jgi:hypothetical protein
MDAERHVGRHDLELLNGGEKAGFTHSRDDTKPAMLIEVHGPFLFTGEVRVFEAEDVEAFREWVRG